MIRDLEQEVPETSETADVCIVGAGAAGIVLALELARLGKKVVLLEAGGRDIEKASQEPYCGVAVTRPHRGLHDGRVRALGGTTNVWGGQILELDALDFEKRDWVPGSGWPFAKTELNRFYARALELEGVAQASQDDCAVWADVGEKKPEFKDLCAYMSRWCREPNFARSHAKELETSEQIETWLHANAVELLLREEEVTGVRCRTLAGAVATFKAAEYCFCLGAIESSRFFLQPLTHNLPWNNSGLLGKQFQDHIDCDAAVVLPGSKRSFHGLFDAVFLRGFKYNPKLRFTEQAQRRLQVLNAGATFYTVSDTDDLFANLRLTAKNILQGRIAQVKGREAWQLLRHTSTIVKQTYRYGVQHRAYHPVGAELRMRVHCEQEPQTGSKIELGKERDALGLLRTRLTWNISEMELQTIRAFVSIAQSSLAGIASLVPDETLAQADGSFLNQCKDSFHHMGGMRMDVSPRRGVVDSTLRLHGTKNAYICSSAVYPTSGFSNPTHTLLALSVRLAEHLAAR